MSQEGRDSSRGNGLAEALGTATRHSQAGRLSEAEALLRQALRDYPDQPDALHLLGLVAHQMGRTETGIQLIERALKASPNASGFQANLAELYRRAGNSRRAIELGLSAVALKPDHADAQFNLGLALLDDGQNAGAIERFDQATRLRPRFAEAINSRGAALRKLGRHAEAESEFRRALSIRPSYPQALNNLGTVLRDLERPAEAVAAYKSALVQQPGYIEALNNLILAHKDMRQFDQAIAVANEALRLSPGNEALRLSPGNVETLTRLAAVQIDRRNPEAAIASIETILAASPAKPEILDMLGRAFAQTRAVEKAVTAYRKAIELKPDFAAAYDNLGNALKELGRVDEALAAFDRALELDPSDSDVYLDLADVNTFRVGDRRLAALEARLTHLDTLAPNAQMALHFAAAKAYDDIARYDDAFAHLSRGNALKRKIVSYDEAAALDFFQRIEASATDDTLRAERGNGHASAQPIFIIGMPRSGSTLVEQILARHPSVQSAGEIGDLSLAIDAACASDGTLAGFPESLRDLSGTEFAAIGDDYLRRLDRYAPGAERIVDKGLSNFYFAGLIHATLPNARIVHVNRAALDTCVSCYSKLFAEGWSQTYDLGELGRYYRAYARLMNHWRAVLPPGAMLDVRYEALVGDLEGQARRLLDYCGLGWHARVLDFHTHTQPVKTASAVQVRRPLYDTSVGRWRRYEAHLAPLIVELGSLCDD